MKNMCFWREIEWNKSVFEVDVINSTGAGGSGPKMFLGAKNVGSAVERLRLREDSAPAEMKSFTNKREDLLINQLQLDRIIY